MVRRVATRGALSDSCFIQALTGASRRQNFESAPLNFCRRRISRKHQTVRRCGDEW